MLRDLGARVVSTRAALDTLADGRTVLVVVERVARGGVYADQEIADWVRDARRLATLEHPNVAKVRDVVIRGEEVSVVGEYLDGVRWSDVTRLPAPVSLEIALRVLVDVLSGLSAVHNLRDAKREPMKLVHGELTPDCVVVGLDGVARIVCTCRVRSAMARPGRDGSAYLAPEVLLADETADARADVYSAGVMLWEALSGKPLFPNTQPSAIVTHLLSGKVVRASIPDGCAWAEPLADVASRALSADPEKRYPSAAALTAELRRIAGSKLTGPVRVAAFVRATFGSRIGARRAELERGEVREVSGVEAQPGRDSIPVEEDASIAPATLSTAPTPIPPPLHEPPAPPVAVAAPVAQAPPVPRMPPVAQSPPAASKAPPVPPAAKAAAKAPALPMRARLPTLTGVAPPASLGKTSEGEGSPVVVVPPSSHPPAPPALSVPTPYVAFEVPSAARIPVDVLASIEPPVADPFPAPAPPVVLPVRQAPPQASPAGLGPPPAPAPPFVAALEPPRRRGRAATVALFVGPLVFAMALIVWWLAARSPSQAALPDISPPAPPTVSAAATAEPPAELPTATAPVATASTEPAPAAHAPAAVPRATATAATTETPAATATAPATHPPVYVAPPWTPPATYAPAPVVRPPNKHKYEPEGI